MSDPRTPASSSRGGSHDFVDRLVSKAFGASQTAAPRVPSTYEPSPSGRAHPSPRASGTHPDGTLHGAGRNALQGSAADGTRGSANTPARVDELDLHLLSDDPLSLTGDANDAAHAWRTARQRDRLAERGSSRDGLFAGVPPDAAIAGSLTSTHSSGVPSSSIAGDDAASSFAADARRTDASHQHPALAEALRALADSHSANASWLASMSSIARAAGGASLDATDTGAGTLGRSPFDTAAHGSSIGRAAARAAGITQSDSFGDDADASGTSGANGARSASAHDSANGATRRGTRGADANDHDSAARHGHNTAGALNARTLEGALLSQDRGLAQRLGAAVAAARGTDRAARRGQAFGDGHDDEAITVNVTIGRIDVRATQAPSSAAKPDRAAGPRPLALDDYLAQRGGVR